MREIRERSGKVEGGSELSVELQKLWENQAAAHFSGAGEISRQVPKKSFSL